MFEHAHRLVNYAALYASGEDDVNEVDVVAICLFTILGFFVSLGLCILTHWLFKNVKQLKQLSTGKAIMTLIISTWIILGGGFVFWGLTIACDPSIEFNTWFNGESFVNADGATDIFKVIMVGMGGNIIFGFIDNAGLFFGISYLDDLFSLLPGGSDANVTAGYGNTFSDFLGAFLGAFVGKFLESSTHIDNAPVWCEAVGVFIGCLIGILVPKLIVRNSATIGLNKNSEDILVGNLPLWQLEVLINSSEGTYPEGIKSYFEVKAKRVFDQLDKDNSGTVEMHEIETHLKKAYGSAWKDEEFQNEIQTVFNVNIDSTSPTYLTYLEWQQVYKDLILRLKLKKEVKLLEDSQTQKKKKSSDSEKKSVSCTSVILLNDADPRDENELETDHETEI